jgi:hypothetical protein
MSSAGSVQQQVTQITVYDTLGVNGYSMLVQGGVYHAVPQVAADGEAISFNVNQLGEVRVVGSVADNAVLPATTYPIWMGAEYNVALPTYDDGDNAGLHADVNGRLLVREDTLTRGTGLRDADTLRVTIATDDFALNTGVISANTQRVTIATDDLIRTDLSNINTTLSNLIDANNSTVALLGIGATFTGVGTDVSGYDAVTIQLFADQDSAADGMQFQFSTDNVNWDDSSDFNMSAGVTRRFQFPVTAQYFRLVYTNGGVAQGVFRAQTILHRDNVLTSIHRIDGSLNNDRSVTVVKSVLAGESTAGGGGFVNVRVTPSGALLGEFSEMAAGAQTVKQAQIAVGVAAVRLTTDGAAPDADRSRLDFRPDPDSIARFWYGSSGVTAANGLEVFPGESVPLLKDANDYYIISDTAAQTVGVVEVE